MQLAAQCDRVILADMGSVELPSVAISVTFMKDALDLLGVEMEVVRCGDFKGAVEPFLLSSMSKHLRKHYRKMVGKMNDDVVRRIANGRGLTHGKVRELQAQRLITAKQALEAGLVDELVPWIGAKKAFAKVAGGKAVRYKSAFRKKQRKSLNFFTLMTNLLNPKKETAADIEDGLVVLHLSGAIVDGRTAAPGSIVSGPTVKTINQIAKDKNAKAVVVRINSPGGSATASEAIVLALKELAKKKPVVFSMGSVAASGGYYVTCIGRPIFAEAATITGSIGVFGMKPNVGALMRRVGLHEEIIGLDEGAEMVSLEKSWSGEHRAVMQNFVNEVYDRFTSHVSASRDIPVHDVLKIAGGRVWSGEQAVANGLVDRIGGLDAAMAMVAKEAKLGDDYEVNHLPEPVDPMDAMMRNLVGVRAVLPTSTLQLIAKRAGGFESALRILVDALTADRPTHVWMMMPEGIQIR
jgi:protease IV